MKRISKFCRAGLAWTLATWTAAAVAAVAAAATVAPTDVHPGFNLFTPQQDVELGRQSAAQVERQIPLLRDPAVEHPIEAIGRRLADAAPGTRFPYQFRVTNLSDVNAFALPGGFLYVNRGLIELVPTEGQLAGVMAHEIAHVALRHPTNQVSKAYLARAGIGLLGGVLGGGNRSSSSIIQAVGGIGLNALFLRFSRTAESQADIVGAQIMARAGYDPREMADMFELLRRQAGRDPGRLERFLSDHPAPVDREERVRQEAARLPRANGSRAQGALPALKVSLRSQPPAVSMKQVANVQSAPPAPAPQPGAIRIEPPAARMRTFTQRTGLFSMDYPENWRPFETREGYGVTIVPQGGVVETRSGEPSIVCGVVVNHYVPFEGTMNDRSGASGPLEGRSRLEDATNDLVRQTTHANPYLVPDRGSVRRLTAGGAPAISVDLSGRSPVTGQAERVRVITRELSDGHVLYVLEVLPGASPAGLSPALDRMAASLRVGTGGSHR